MSGHTSFGKGEPETPRRQWSDGLLLGSLGVLAFSGTLPATRAAVSSFSPLILTCARIEIAAALGVLTLLITRQWRFPEKWHLPGILWMGFGLAVGYPFFVAVALQQVPAVHGAVVIGLAPAVTALIAVMRAGERPPPAFWIACLVGVGTVLFFTVHQGGGHITLADGWLVFAMLSVGMAYVEGGRVSRELGGTTTLCWAMILLAPITAVPLGFALWQHEWASTPVSAWARFCGLLFLGVKATRSYAIVTSSRKLQSGSRITSAATVRSSPSPICCTGSMSDSLCPNRML